MDATDVRAENVPVLLIAPQTAYAHVCSAPDTEREIEKTGRKKDAQEREEVEEEEEEEERRT